jgi:hypothetical protein
MVASFFHKPREASKSNNQSQRNDMLQLQELTQMKKRKERRKPVHKKSLTLNLRGSWSTWPRGRLQQHLSL